MNGTIRGDGAMSSEYGRRLLPVELDRIAKADPGRPYFARPRDHLNIAAGFEDISYHRVANAVNRTAHWLQSELGRPKDFRTIAYLAAPDVRNVLLALAVSKVGFKASSVFPGGIDWPCPHTPVAPASFPPQQRSRQCQPFRFDPMRHTRRNRSACTLCTRSPGSAPNQHLPHPILEPAAC